jgi:uncharacterized protein (TIGR02271 family)
MASTADNRALYKIADLYPDYKKDIFGGNDIKGDGVYGADDEKIGAVYDVLVDRGGNFRYFVVNTGFLGIGKKVLLPVGQARIDSARDRIYASSLTKEQSENLPEYDDDMTVDYDYEENVRNSYRSSATGATGVAATGMATSGTYDRSNYNYDRDPSLYNMNDTDHQTLKLFEERLIANKERFRTGTVSIGKHVETQTAQVSIPVEKEKIVIERKNPTNSTAVTPDANAFKEGEVARMDIYEESANVQKQAFVREEVNIRKEVKQETVNAQETIRREELDVDVDDDTNVRRDR